MVKHSLNFVAIDGQLPKIEYLSLSENIIPLKMKNVKDSVGESTKVKLTGFDRNLEAEEALAMNCSSYELVALINCDIVHLGISVFYSNLMI